MRFRVHHETRYRYRAPVTLGAHVIRLRPREDATQRLVHHSLVIDPAPEKATGATDAEGNVITYAWFTDVRTDALTITSAFEVETLRTDAFDYLLDANFTAVPVRYPIEVARVLQPYLAGEAAASVRDFATAVRGDAGEAPPAFLDALNRAIHTRTRLAIRDDGRPAQSAAETLALGRGACRDATVLFMEAARCMGFAARFVSGYRRGDLTRPDRHLHAWAEVFVPGGGWRGWDPVEGVGVADRHVALAASAEQMHTMPVSGAYFGSGVGSTLGYTIRIEAESHYFPTSN
ncbi:MAG TPA: transglutaminase family protein [Burkholderiales bacterium]|nr:transglutaminase family protein [Burkholderiales bacterium]